MDDTLYDEIDYYKSGFAVVAGQIADNFGLQNKIIFETLWKIFNSGNHKTVFNAAAEQLGIVFDKNYIEKLVDVFRNHKPAIKLPSASKQILADLKKQYKLGLVTDGWLPAQEYKVKAFGIDKFFDCIIYTDKLGTENWKPSPKAYEKLLAELDVTAAESVYVGDNLTKDFISPNKMGFKTIRIVRPNRIHLEPAPSLEAEPQYEINSIAKLTDLLRKIDAV